jgi:hypothetical protein
MVAHDSHRIGEMEQDQTPDDRVERPPGVEGTDVTLHEANPIEACIGSSPLGSLEQFGRLLDPDDRAFRADERRDELGYVPEAAAEVEDVHSRPDSCRLEHQTCRLLDGGRLRF